MHVCVCMCLLCLSSFRKFVYKMLIISLNFIAVKLQCIFTSLINIFMNVYKQTCVRDILFFFVFFVFSIHLVCFVALAVCCCFGEANLPLHQVKFNVIVDTIVAILPLLWYYFCRCCCYCSAADFAYLYASKTFRFYFFLFVSGSTWLYLMLNSYKQNRTSHGWQSH